MLTTIFTPSHKRKKLLKAYESLRAQTQQNFEWVILLNGEEGNLYGAKKDETISVDTQKVLGFEDARVKVFLAPRSIKGNIGWLKKECCRLALGDIYFELDHDDWLREDAIEKCEAAFADPTVDFVYSDCYELNVEGKSFAPYGAYWGWTYRTEANGEVVTEAKDPHPAVMSWIYYAPNHFRSWRASFYNKIGGHNVELDCCDDFDMVCRTYIAGKMVHIKEALYYYHHNGENTSGQTDKNNKNARIQQLTAQLHDKYQQHMCLKWAKENNLLALDFGGRFNCPPGFTSVDLFDAEIAMDLQGPWDKLQDNSVGVLRAHHLLEHLSDTIHFFNEAFRVLVPGGYLLIEVPSENGTGGSSDPTHVKWFNRRSFKYFTQERLARFIRPQYRGKFQLNRISEYYWIEEPDVMVIRADMICLKGDYESHWVGEKLM